MCQMQAQPKNSSSAKGFLWRTSCNTICSDFKGHWTIILCLLY